MGASFPGAGGLVRLDPSRSGGGSGLGLSITRGVTEAHGGSLVLVPTGPVGHGSG